MGLLPIQLITPASSLAYAAGSTAVAAGTGFAEMLQNAFSPSPEPDSEKNAGAGGSGSAPVFGVTAPFPVVGFREQTEALVSGFHRVLNEVMAANGIDLSAGVHLQTDGFGQVRVVGDHPQKREIETLIASHSELEATFREISARSSLQQAIDEHTAGSSNSDSTGVDKTLFDLYVNSQRTEITFLPEEE